ISRAIMIGRFHYSLSTRKWVPKTHKNIRFWAISPQDGRYAVRAGRSVQRAAGLGKRHGGVMRIRRELFIPAILALGGAGSLLTGSAMPIAAACAPSVHVQAAAASANPKMVYHG